MLVLARATELARDEDGCRKSTTLVHVLESIDIDMELVVSSIIIVIVRVLKVFCAGDLSQGGAI